MLKKRLIFTLLVDGDNFVLSRNFNLQKVGDINWLLDNYNFSNVSNFIDELVVLNIRNKKKNFNNFCKILKKITKKIFIPIAAGGGINSVSDVKKLLRSGADKIVLNSMILEENQELIKIYKYIGKQSIIGSLDVKLLNKTYFVYNNNKNINQSELSEIFDKKKLNYIGEIYLNSIDKDGTGQGYDFQMLKNIKKNEIPIILAGGVGNWRHLLSGLENKKINAAATANLLNFIGNGFENARNNLFDKCDLAKW